MQNSIERVDGHLRERIKEELKIIEETYDVKICLAANQAAGHGVFPRPIVIMMFAFYMFPGKNGIGRWKSIVMS